MRMKITQEAIDEVHVVTHNGFCGDFSCEKCKRMKMIPTLESAIRNAPIPLGIFTRTHALNEWFIKYEDWFYQAKGILRNETKDK